MLAEISSVRASKLLAGLKIELVFLYLGYIGSFQAICKARGSH